MLSVMRTVEALSLQSERFVMMPFFSIDRTTLCNTAFDLYMFHFGNFQKKNDEWWARYENVFLLLLLLSLPPDHSRLTATQCINAFELALNIILFVSFLFWKTNFNGKATIRFMSNYQQSFFLLLAGFWVLAKLSLISTICFRSSLSGKNINFRFRNCQKRMR